MLHFPAEEYLTLTYKNPVFTSSKIKPFELNGTYF